MVQTSLWLRTLNMVGMEIVGATLIPVLRCKVSIAIECT